MHRSTAGPRLARWKAALALAVTTTSLVASASVANAATFNPVDGPALQSAIVLANSTAAQDTIILRAESYLVFGTLTITNPLVITGDHANQSQNGGPTIDATFVDPASTGDFLTIATGVNVSLQGITLTNAGDAAAVAIRNNGNLRLENAVLSGNGGTQLSNQAGSTSVINNTSIDNGAGPGVTNTSATAVFNNSLVAFNNVGVFSNVASTVRFNNTIIAANDPSGNGFNNCNRAATSQIRSMSSDATCGVSFQNTDPLLVASTRNGGPSQSLALEPTSPAINAGDNATCQTTDQRFFPRTDGACDIGAYEFGAVQDIVAPTCTVTQLRAGPPKQQDVTAIDSGSGLGSDAISNTSITNGSIAFTPFVNPSRSGLVLTATKSDQQVTTSWSFTATDWAGNAKFCI